MAAQNALHQLSLHNTYTPFTHNIKLFTCTNSLFPSLAFPGEYQSISFSESTNPEIKFTYFCNFWDIRFSMCYAGNENEEREVAEKEKTTKGRELNKYLYTYILSHLQYIWQDVPRVHISVNMEIVDISYHISNVNMCSRNSEEVTAPVVVLHLVRGIFTRNWEFALKILHCLNTMNYRDPLFTPFLTSVSRRLFWNARCITKEKKM